MSFAHTLTREQARQLDRRAIETWGVPSLVLMENAGRGAADVLFGLGIDGPVLVCCGRGNNGGDGFVLARHLVVRGFSAAVLAWGNGSQLSPDARTNANILEKLGHTIEWIDEGDPLALLLQHARQASWIVDALLGTGSAGAPRSPLDGVIRAINASERPVFALDVPSGLDCDTGLAAAPTIRAASTCTFAAAKPGLLLPVAAPFVGELFVADIGVPAAG